MKTAMLLAAGADELPMRREELLEGAGQNLRPALGAA